MSCMAITDHCLQIHTRMSTLECQPSNVNLRILTLEYPHSNANTKALLYFNTRALLRIDMPYLYIPKPLSKWPINRSLTNAFQIGQIYDHVIGHICFVPRPPIRIREVGSEGPPSEPYRSCCFLLHISSITQQETHI